MKLKTIKLLQENTEENLCNLSFRQRFLRYDTESTILKRKNLINWTSSKLNAYSSKDVIKKMEETGHKMGEKIIANHVSDKELISQHIKNSYNSIIRQTPQFF